MGMLTPIFFHKIANGRRRKNIIYSSKSEQDVIQGTDPLIQHATSFYQALFGKCEGDLVSLC